MKKRILSLALAFAFVLASASVPPIAYGAERQVTVSVANFPVSLNELRFDNNDYARYPLIVYRDITYFPMTYHQSNLLNLNTSWTAEGGLVVAKGNPETAKQFLYETPVASRNSGTQAAYVVDSKVTVNGKAIDNQSEQYPLLRFRDITYFPMTWRFAVDEFGWDYAYGNATGLTIRADNFFYIADDAYISKFEYDAASGGYSSIVHPSETHYIKGDLWVCLKTDSQRLTGIVGSNLTIVKNGAETMPDGYFGYYHGIPPLFTVDGNIINTTYFPIPNDYSDWEMNVAGRTPRLVRVNIDTGQII
jgi:hypothetical protein